MGRYDVLLQAQEKPIPRETEVVSGRPATPKMPPAQTNHTAPERPNARTVERPNGKRIITRNSFEIYEDQMDDLRELAFEEKRQGKLGSMSAMVRDAVDTYLARSKKA
jgi:hypothetical protein